MNALLSSPLRTLPIVAVLGVCSPAMGATAQDQAAADVLFKEAKQLAASGDFEHACPKFAESQRIDPSSGTLLNIGNCYEKLGKLASAYGAFREAEVSARNKGDNARQTEAARRADALAPRLAKLAIVVPPPARVPGFELKRDGSVVGEGQWGTSIPVDVGHHEIVASAPGHKPWSTVARIDTDGSAASVEVPPLEAGAAGDSPSRWTGSQVAGVVLGSAGAAGLIVGAGLGGVALSKNSSSKSNCSPMDPNFCNDTGVSLRKDAIAFGNGSTAALIVGGVLVTTGIVLVLTGTRSKREGAWIEVRPGVGSLALRGGF